MVVVIGGDLEVVLFVVGLKRCDGMSVQAKLLLAHGIDRDILNKDGKKAEQLRGLS